MNASDSLDDPVSVVTCLVAAGWLDPLLSDKKYSQMYQELRNKSLKSPILSSFFLSHT